MFIIRITLNIFKMHSYQARVPFDSLTNEDGSPLEHATLHTAYNGQIFTGIAIEHSASHYFQYNYRKGKRHGKSFGIELSNNKLIYKETFVRGNVHGNSYRLNEALGFEKRSEYQFGQLIKDNYYSLNGILLRHYDIDAGHKLEYYDNGSLFLQEKEIRKGTPLSRNQFYYLGSEVLWLARKINDTVWEFNEELIFERIDDFTAHFHHEIIKYFIYKLIAEDKEAAFEFAVLLANHNDLFFVGQSAKLFGLLGDKRGMPYLENMMAINTVAEVRWDRFNHSSLKSLPINQIAIKSIKAL